MRYQALEIYSALLRAGGIFVLLSALTGGILLGVAGFRSPDHYVQGLCVAGGVVFGLLGAAVALLYMASGQLICVLVDIEANTRVTARKP